MGHETIADVVIVDAGFRSIAALRVARTHGAKDGDVSLVDRLG